MNNCMIMEILGCFMVGGGGYIGLVNKKFGYLKCFNFYYFIKYIVMNNIVYIEMLFGYILCRLNYCYIFLIKYVYRGESMFNFVDKD